MYRKSITLIAMAIILSLGILAAGCDNFFNDMVSKGPHKVAFPSLRNGAWDIYTVNIDGTEETRLTFDLAADELVPA